MDGDSGYVDFVEFPRPHKEDPAAIQIQHRSVYIWRPPADIEPKLPPGHNLALECCTFRDGIRRFWPVCFKTAGDPASGTLAYDATAFALHASIGGRALMWRDGEGNPFPLFTFEESRLFFT